MFNARFYQTVLPEVVQQRCQEKPGHVTAVELHLPDGMTLDLCHITTLADDWFGVAYFTHPTESEDVGHAFLPYGLVQWITIAVHPPEVRHMGFSVERSRAAIAPPDSPAR